MTDSYPTVQYFQTSLSRMAWRKRELVINGWHQIPQNGTATPLPDHYSTFHKNKDLRIEMPYLHQLPGGKDTTPSGPGCQKCLRCST